MTKAGNQQRDKRKKAEKETQTKSKKEDRQLKKLIKKRQAREKNYESQEEREFMRYMHSIGCQIKYIEGDGNCMFRSIADQLTGEPNQHADIRRCVMDYVEQHHEHFALFIEDDETIEEYVSRMRNDKEWGDHPELYAASQVFSVDIVVHQHNTPRYVIACQTAALKRIHLSYHGEYHYNSVRAITDSLDGIPATITIHEPPATEDAPSSSASRAVVRDRAEEDKELITRSVPWADAKTIELALKISSGDAMSAIELLINDPEGFETVAQAIDYVEEETQQQEAKQGNNIAAAIPQAKPTRNKPSKAKVTAHSTRNSKASSSSEPTEQQALSKKEKRLLRQGRKATSKPSAPVAMAVAGPGEVAI